MYIDPSNSNNILVIGICRSGKSYQLYDAVRQLLKADKRVFLLFQIAPLFLRHSPTPKNCYLDLDHLNLTKENDCDFPESFYQNCYDAVVIDEIHMLNKKAKEKLFWLIKDRPGMKFLISAQLFQNKEMKKHFDKAFIGYIHVSLLDELSEALDIDRKTIELCCNPGFRNQFLELDLRTKAASAILND